MSGELQGSDVATVVQLLEVTAARGAYELEHFALVKQTFDHYNDVMKNSTPLNPMFVKHAADMIVLASQKHCFGIHEFGTISQLHTKLVNVFQRFIEQPLGSGTATAAGTASSSLALAPESPQSPRDDCDPAAA